MHKPVFPFYPSDEQDAIVTEHTLSPVTDDSFAMLVRTCPTILVARRIAVGVSGGADSMALCLLADTWARNRGVELTALTVDHGLRAAATIEAEQVATWLAARDIAHRILPAPGGRPATALQRIARDRRFNQIDRWCRDHDHDAVMFAHTAEDQAETAWMRILADSGPDGLAAMIPETRVAGLTIARPLLNISKPCLIATCRARQQSWIDDPSNRNPAFTRVRLRRSAASFAASGLGAERVRRFAACMTVARQAIDRACCRFLRNHGGIAPAGWAWFDSIAFCDLPTIIGDGLLTRLLWGLGGRPYPPRRKRVSRLATELRFVTHARTRTLGGCIVIADHGGQILLCREPGKVEGLVCLQPGRRTRWDNRFEAIWSGSSPIWLGALGEAGLANLVTRNQEFSSYPALESLPRPARLAHPAIQMLDGTLYIPHLYGNAVRQSGEMESLLDTRFCPDADWVGRLAAMKAN